MEENLPKFINYKLSNDYIRGLTDGEGCFTFTTTNKTTDKEGNIFTPKIPTFTLSMNVRDRWLIVSVADYLGIGGNVYIHKNWKGDGYNRGDMAKFMVRSAKELQNIIIPFFYKKLAGYKGDQFIEWLEKIGTNPEVPERYKIIHRLYKSGYWETKENIPEKFRN
ncbi:MAG: LAGLIDADG family homing endonuclease [Candidatus Harrisonbacteria bacterium]|nr:LAGLIDADG family homing endonuclease [Candidatus Harrisonbacteria bacterium]